MLGTKAKKANISRSFQNCICKTRCSVCQPSVQTANAHIPTCLVSSLNLIAKFCGHDMRPAHFLFSESTWIFCHDVSLAVYRTPREIFHLNGGVKIITREPCLSLVYTPCFERLKWFSTAWH